jgi:hypothetical protein
LIKRSREQQILNSLVIIKAEINLTVPCTYGLGFQFYFYKYFAALLLNRYPDKSKQPAYLNDNKDVGDRPVQSTGMFVANEWLF